MLSVAKLVGEGYEKPSGDSSTPLDIGYNKLVDWLVDRKLLPQDWNRKLQTIQANANRAVNELSPTLKSKLEGIDDLPVDYYGAKQILAELALTAERGLLGSYKGDAGVWEKIVKAYESQNICLVESGQALGRNVDFEIPFLKKQTAKNQQLMADLDKRKADLLKSAASAVVDYQNECKQLGIQEVRTATELHSAVLSMATDLPALVESAVTDGISNASKVQEAVDYYARFLKTLSETAQVTLPTLSEVLQGKTAGPAPELLQAITDSRTSGEAEASVADIDWGNDLGGESNVADSNISWDLDLSAAAETIQVVDTAADSGAGISWDIDIDVDASGEGALGNDNSISLDINTVAASPDDITASLNQASDIVKRLVCDHAYRALLLDDLYELSAFLKRRSAELSSKDLSSSLGPEENVSEDIAKEMLHSVENAIKLLTDDKVKRLLSIATSAQYRKRLVESLVAKAGQEAKFNAAAEEATSRKVQVQRELMGDAAKLAAVQKKTRDMKIAVEQMLGAKLGRKINIQGEINNIV